MVAEECPCLKPPAIVIRKIEQGVFEQVQTLWFPKEMLLHYFHRLQKLFSQKLFVLQ
jgi:hypothetical protein